MGSFNNTQISIIGLGNLGINIGHLLLSNNNNLSITGFDLVKDQSKLAKDSKSITKEANSYAECLNDTNLIILAVPTSSTYEIFESIKDIISDDTHIIDFSSNKRAVSSWANEMIPNTEIIGLYPFVKSDTLLGINWGVVNYLNSKSKIIDICKLLIKDANGFGINIDINEHDSYVGLVEAMPFLLSSLLIKLSHNSSAWKEVFR